MSPNVLTPSTAERLPGLARATAPMQAAAEYWKTVLSDAPGLLELPTDHARPARQDHAGARVGVELGEALSAGLDALSRRHGATPYLTLLAGWAVVLSRLSGQADVVVGTPAADRGRREAEGPIGFAANPLAIRVDLSGAPTVAELLGRVKERALGAQHHPDVSFEQVVELLRPARGLSHHPLFQVAFAWRTTPRGDGVSLPAVGVGGGLAGDVEGVGPSSRVRAELDLSLVLGEREGRIAGSVTYATALFERATVERWVGYLRRVLEGMVADDTQPVDRLELLPAEERARVVVEWNRGEAAYPRESCIHALFEAQARRTPAAVAVETEDRALAYAELNARANRLAHHLRSLGVGPDARVALCVERGVETVVAMLAVLKAGGAYVPLDPAYPDERLRYMLADSRPAVLLASRSQAARFAAAGVPVLDPADEAAWAHLPATDPRQAGLSPDHPGYVIYTSGSTGRPKGVTVPHRGVVSLLADVQRRAPIGEGDGCGLWTSTSFDVSVYEIFSALLAGGRLCIPRDEARLEAGAFLDWMEARGVRSAYLPPYFLPALRDRVSRSPGRARLHRLLVGVEPIAEPLLAEIRRSVPGLRIINGYGPTETTICATLYDVPEEGRGERVTPIGPPAANTRVFVLDARMRPVPIGVVGELYVGGVGVARGYLDRPALTAERFVPDPLSGEPGARLYRTGDLGRWLPEGALAFAGRTDAQVKVRGYRVEPGEIEARLVEHPAVREAVVLAREDAPGEKRLVAYVVGDEAGAELLRAHLAERLPEHMVPAAYVRLDALPLTPSGKVDRKALPAPEGDAFPARGYEAPSGRAEEALAEIWSAVLGVERVGRRDHFMELGGHSLSGVQVTSRVRAALGVEVPLAALLGRPVLADFAREVETAARSEAAAIAPVDRTAAIAPSFAQQRLWFLEQLGGMGAAYHIPTSLRLRGDLDRGALERALDHIVARHEALRTTFPAVDGEPVQRIAPVEESAFRLVEHDLHASADPEDALRRLVHDEGTAPFDLARGPLIRGRLVRMAADDHVLLLTMHHIVSDGWSMGVLHRELGALYAAFARGEPDPLPPLPVQYADYAAWQRRWIEGDVLQAQAEYWRETLAGAPELLELPADHPRPARQDFAGAAVNVELDAALTAGLKALGARQGTTLHMTLLAGWAAVLARLSGQDEVVVGTPSANRGRSEIEDLIGFFVNTLALRVDLSGAPSVAELLGRVKARSLGAQQHQDIPFEQVVERVQPVRSLAHTPLFQVMFVWQNAPGSHLELPGLALGPLDPAGTGGSSSPVSAKFDLSLVLWENGGRIEGAVEYATALFERETVERYVGYLGRVLEEMAADDAKPVERLELLSAAERRRVVEAFNDRRAEYPREAFVHEQLEAQAARTPGAAALVFEDETLSYAELNARANRLAHHLRSLGVGPDARVGICAERGLEMVVGVLAVLKAGGAYLPLDPAYPGERLRYMLEDGAPAAVLVQAHLRDRVERADVPVVELDAAAPAWAALPATDPGRGGLTPDHLAYVIYTSGSTGRPKGVRVPHGSLGATLAVARDAFGLGAGDRVPSLASFAFDIWLFETLLPLLGGGTVRLVPRERVPDVPRLVEDLARCTVLHAVPALMRRIVEEVRATPGGVLGTLRHAFVGGDAVAPDLLEEMRAAFPAALVHVLYGPTEAAIICAAHRLGSEPAARQMVGRPLGNAALYVVERGGNVAPVGVPGELCLGGASVARDYLGRPGLTAERFVPDPFSAQPGARLYRTGDRVRWRYEGAEVRECGSALDPREPERTSARPHSRTAVLEFLGRTDFQVKVRGFRIEPGEIEARLLEHAGVREAVVLVREDTPGEKRLVAYVAGDETAAAEVLRAHLSERLPEYMVPAAYVRLDALPLTPNGKVDRRALPAPEGDAFPARGYEAPSGRAEEAVAAIWAELLGVERVGRRDRFFELGGHSLLATRVVSRVRQALGVEASARDVFERPVLADFARGLEAAARAEAAAIGRVDRTGSVPLSFAQQRLWFLEQLGTMGSTYQLSLFLRLRGELDRGALVRSLDRIVARHEALRTTFPTVDGEPVQRIAPVEASAFRLVEHDLRAAPDAEDALRRLVRDEAGAPFDLAQGPLARGRLVRMAADDHVLLLTMHHIVSDGWSMGVLYRELGALYAAFARGEPDPLPPLPVQYADYAVWHRRLAEGEVLRRQGDYWRETLAGAPELLELPADHPRPARQDFAGASLKVELDEALTAALKTLSRRHGATLYMTLLAGWAAVLARLSGQDEVVVGAPSANRGRSEIEDLIGFFVNTLPLRVDLSGAPTVAEALGRVKARALEAQANQDIPFEQVVERVQPARSLAHTPLFQVMFAWQNAPESSLELPGLRLSPADAAPHVTAKFDLLLSLGEVDGRIAGDVEYATSLFERATVERHLGYLRRVLEQMAADDAAPVDRLELLSAAERRMVVEAWNATDAAYPRELCLHELFEAQAERAPEAVAVVHADRSLTYAELNARANRLAHHLRERGVGPGARVAVCAERGLEMMVGLLGVLKAGAAYVPLDPAYPEERLRLILEDSVPAAVLTHGEAAARLAAAGVPALPLGDDAAWAERPATNPPRAGLEPRHLAYLIYTSGSTGRPKGVMIEHRNAVNFVCWGRGAFARDQLERTLFATSLNFDLHVFEAFVPLSVGAGVHVVRDALQLPQARRVTLVNTVPSAMKALVETGGVPASVRTVNLAGEPLKEALAGEIFRTTQVERLCNLYGPSETTTYSTWVEMRRGDGFAPHIGRAVANTRVYLLDRAGGPVPVGVTGELYIGGDGVARGYLNRPALTAERFVPDPFSAREGARMYRTGDLGRWRADGNVQFLGRNDFQVKIRGFRIEPGEVEARLLEHPGVREAVVLAREDAPGERRLVAYCVGDALDADALRAHLAARLPEHLVPAALVRLDALPLTPNGKLDRKALPAPDGGAYAARGYEAPVGEAETVLAGIWAELLGAERVGRRDHFFALGGHSLLAVQVVSRVRQALGVEAEIGDLFVRPVLADFARGVETAARAEAPAITPVDRSAPIPLSFAQQRLWFLERLGDLGGTYHVPSRLRLKGALDLDALAGALDRIVARHEALRTTFVEVNGVPEQRIAPAEASGFHLVEHDLGGRADAEAELDRWMDAEARAPFDLERGPLVRGRLVRLAADDHVLLVTMHHIVSDGWSMGVLFGELSALYAAFRDGGPDPLPGLPVQYADYAAWQRGWVEGELLERQARYWERALAGAPALLELPTDRARPPKQDFAGDAVDVELDEALTAALKALSRRHGATLFMTLLAGWATVLARLSGQDDVVVGTPSANRGRREIEELIGFFVNTLALRVDLSGAATVAEVLARVKARALEAQANQDIPFEQVVERVQPARSLAHAPLFQVMFAWQNAPDASPALPGLRAEAVAGPAYEAAKFDLTLTLAERGDRIVGGLSYARALFERGTAERWAGYLRRVLEEMAADESRSVERLALLDGAERALVLEAWNRTEAEVPADRCIHELFEAQAARTPGAVAVLFEDEALTYDALNRSANRLAHHLRGLGVGPDARVAVCVERGPEMIAALLAILKAGGAYLPLDPAYPADRLRAMLEDSAPAALVTQSSLSGTFAGLGVPAVELDAPAPAWAQGPETNPARAGLTPEHLAYVIYTSGSTGRPKGVMVEHRGLVNHTAWQAAAFGIGARDTVLQRTSISFDASVWELWTPLATGARMRLLSFAAAKDPAAIGRVMAEGGVTVAQFVPTLLQAVLGARPAGAPLPCRVLFCGGEPLPAALVEEARAAGAGEVVNLYGPTEATIDSTSQLCGPDGRAPAIGRPIANARTYVLDARGEPAPVGVAGELYVGGAGVARGYLGRAGLTAERFVPDALSGTPGARLYRTGDRGRWRADGTLEFLGRTDFQVKIRGFRIEPGEIEARLLEHAGVREAVVLAREDAPGDRRLVAYVVGEEAPGAEALRAHLGRTLPAYMVPAAYVRLERLPLTPNGKLDRRALPAPEGGAHAAREYEAPVGKVEQALAGIWAELLGVERVGRGDDFFALGGHSLLAVQMISRVRQAMEVELALGAVFEHPVLAALAERILHLRLARFDPETLARLARLVREPGAPTP